MDQEVWSQFGKKLDSMSTQFRVFEKLLSEDTKNIGYLKDIVGGWSRNLMSPLLRKAFVEALVEAGKKAEGEAAE